MITQTLRYQLVRVSFAHTKRGMGMVIVLVIILLMGLAIIGLANYKFVERTTLDVGASINGDIALLYAQSAVEEAIHITSSEINDPNTKLFQDIRDQAIRGPISWTIPVPILANEILDQEESNRYELVDGIVNANVLMQKSFGGLLYEKYGTIEFKAKVRAKLGFTRSLEREYTEHIGFRMQLISTPRPFDQASLYVQDIGGWIYPKNYNYLVKQSKEHILQKTPDWRKRFENKINDQKQAIEFIGENVNELLNLLNRPPLLNSIPAFTPFQSEIIALSLVKNIDLQKLNISPELKFKNKEISQKFDEVKEKDDELDKAIQELENLPKKRSSIGKAKRIINDKVKPLLKEFAQLTRDYSKLHTERIQILSDFQKLVKTPGGPKAQRIAVFYKKLNNINDWETKANYVVKEEPGDLQNNFKALFDRVSAAGDSVNGVVYIKNPNTKLKLPSRLKGKLVIVTEGDVQIDNLLPEDSSKHVLSVISYGDMRVSGSIKASLMPQGNFQVIGSLSVDGNLVFNRITDPNQLKGQLNYDPLLHSGTTTANSDANAKRIYYYAVLEPMSVGINVQRMSMGLQ
ncbi:MAG: hypothetical protein VX619_07635 [bacterium]|nr:hypothetical protein [bacterium]